MANTERFLCVSELAARYGLSRGAFYKMARRGDFPAGVHFGRAHRWPLSQLQAWEAARVAEATA